jgi:hypothetical protein
MAVVGAGRPAGRGIGAARVGSVVLLEQLPRPGKKLLATGAAAAIS